MNAPNPTLVPQGKTYEYQIQGIAYTITNRLESGSLKIVIKKEEELPRKIFESKIAYDELVKISKMFLAFETIEEIAGEFNAIFQENKYKIKEDNDKLLLYMIFAINDRKTNEICLEIPQSNGNDNILLEICYSINQMKKTLSAIGEKLTIVENEVQMIKEGKTRIEIIDKDFQDEIESKITNKKIKWKLIYRATIDGDTSQIFHKHCDNKNATLVVVKTIKDVIFGGYTSISWNQCGNYQADTKAFLFSNNLKKLYPIQATQHAIYCNSTYGPTFGAGHDFYIASKCLTVNTNYVNTNSFASSIGYELNNNEKSFTAKEVEIYKQINY